ncbi:MAG: HIT family protein [Kordiimonadaceae bacterium]|nr:HIT family protein [Kordiimonadaceae bacterium]
MSLVPLHPQLAADSVPVVEIALCDVRLIADATYPWLILVPRREGVREIHALDDVDQQQLMQEISFVSQLLEELTGADKMNVAALGNMVPQLHIHIIARFVGDAAWPAPVWGATQKKPYSDDALESLVTKLKSALT